MTIPEYTGGGGERGPVRILCDEIGFEFSPALERPDVLVAFVRQLVGEVELMRDMASIIAERFGGKAPSDGSLEVMNLCEAMLTPGADKSVHVGAAFLVHEACHRLNPDDTYPTDHLIDMLSSCASAIRFGLDQGRFGIGSRHAAEASHHIWGRLYSIGLQDSHTPAWANAWARSKLMAALISLLPPLSESPAEGHGTNTSDSGGEEP